MSELLLVALIISSRVWGKTATSNTLIIKNVINEIFHQLKNGTQQWVLADNNLYNKSDLKFESKNYFGGQ